MHGFIISDEQPYTKRSLSETNRFTASINAFHSRLKCLNPEFKSDLPDSGRLSGLSDTRSWSWTCSFAGFSPPVCTEASYPLPVVINCFISHNGSAICKGSVWNSRHWVCVVSCLISGCQAENIPVEERSQRLRFTPAPEPDCHDRLDTKCAADDKTI